MGSLASVLTVITPVALLEQMAIWMSGALHQPLDQTRFVVAILIQLPFAMAFRKLKGNSAHIVSIITGVSVLYFLYGVDVLHSAISSSVVFLLVRWLPSTLAHRLAISFAFAYILGSHIFRMYIDYLGWKADFTAPQMILSIKLTAYAWSCRDGEIMARRGTPEASGLTEREKQYAIAKQPGLLEYFGWIYFCPGLLAGPSTEFHEYRSFIDRSMFSADGGVIPFDLLAIIRPIVVGLGAVSVIALVPQFSVATVQHIVQRPEEWSHLPALQIVALVVICGPFIRMKYYFVWKLSEAVGNLCGIGYSGRDASGKRVWQRFCNGNIVAVELPLSLKTAIDNWNITTQHWLRFYVYERLRGTMFEEWRGAVTFLTSAVWHGLYPGYYMGFLSLAACRHVAMIGRRKMRPRFLALPAWMRPALLYDVITVCLTLLALTSCAAPFWLLSFEQGWKIWTRMRFIGFWPVIIGAVVLPLLPTPRAAAGREQKRE